MHDGKSNTRKKKNRIRLIEQKTPDKHKSMITKPSKSKKQLLKKPENYGKNAFPDTFLVIACYIEESLIQGGASPGVDYSVLDLYNLAQPFVLHRFQKGELTDWNSND